MGGEEEVHLTRWVLVRTCDVHAVAVHVGTVDCTQGARLGLRGISIPNDLSQVAHSILATQTTDDDRSGCDERYELLKELLAPVDTVEKLSLLWGKQKVLEAKDRKTLFLHSSQYLSGFIPGDNVRFDQEERFFHISLPSL